jgi:hypothetical protein
MFMLADISHHATPPPTLALGQGLLIIGRSRSNSDTAQSLEILCTSDKPNAETSIWRHTTLKTDSHLCPQQDSNPQFQQASGHWDRDLLNCLYYFYLNRSSCFRAAVGLLVGRCVRLLDRLGLLWKLWEGAYCCWIGWVCCGTCWKVRTAVGFVGSAVERPDWGYHCQVWVTRFVLLFPDITTWRWQSKKYESINIIVTSVIVIIIVKLPSQNTITSLWDGLITVRIPTGACVQVCDLENLINVEALSHWRNVVPNKQSALLYSNNNNIGK